MLEDAKNSALRGNPFGIGRLGKLVAAKALTDAALAAYKRGWVDAQTVYRPFNFALRGYPAGAVDEVVDEYSRETVAKVDHRMLRPIMNARYSGKATGILSRSYREMIMRTLFYAGYPYTVFEMVVASDLERRDGLKAKGFTLDVQGRKAAVLEDRFFRGRGFYPRERDFFRPEATYYFGDDPSMDDDGQVAEMLPSGHFIVPFFATDANRQEFASRWHAVVPESEEDMRRFLKSL